MNSLAKISELRVKKLISHDQISARGKSETEVKDETLFTLPSGQNLSSAYRDSNVVTSEVNMNTTTTVTKVQHSVL